MNYLESIENEYSRGRGKDSRLVPLDWQLGESWEKSGIPIHIVLNSMQEGFKNYAAKNPKGEIGSLRYFIPMVNKNFAGWQTSQVGKAPEPITRKTSFEEDNMQNVAIKQSFYAANENVEILDNLATALMPNNFARCNVTLPEPLRSAVVKLRGEILALLDDATQKQLSAAAIESRLTELRADLEISLIVSESEEERARIIKEVRAEYGKFTLLPDVERKVLIRKLYNKFSLPELSLYAF